MTHYDLAVIGSGSGNSLITDDMAGWQVAVIEEGRFGGTCLNVGCIPTKMLVHPADVATAVREAGRLGVDARLEGVRWRDLRDRVFGRIDPISAGGLRYRQEGERTTALLGHARFTGPRALTVDADGSADEVTADRVVIATGSHPVVPPVITEAQVPFHTSDTVMRIDELPRRMVVLGGGYVGAELAHVFAACGVQVAVVSRGQRLLTHQEQQIGEEFTRLAGQRWELHLGRQVAAAREAGGEVHLDLDDGTTVSGDLLLVATGRRPGTEDLGLEAAGVRTHPDGRVVVDEHGRTTADGVWALGDVSSPYQLKHVANHEARRVAHNLTHPDDLRAVDHRFVPAAVFSHPQVASVGLTSEQAREQGIDAAVATQRFGDVAYGWAMEDTTSLCTLVADRATGRLVGAHLMGPEASILIQPAVQAMSFGLPVADMARGQYWIHPALTEVLENALLALDLPHHPV